MNNEQITEFVRCAKLAIATCEDPHLSMVTVDRDIQQLEVAIRNLSSKEKAPEPVAWIERRFAHGELVLQTISTIEMYDSERLKLAEHYDLEIEPLVRLSDISALQKQVQALQADSKKSKEALAEAVKAIYFDDSSDFGSALWKIVLFLGGEEASDLLGYNEKSAYKKYVEGLVKS